MGPYKPMQNFGAIGPSLKFSFLTPASKNILQIFFGTPSPSRATYLDLHDETLVYFFRLVAVFEQIVRIPTSPGGLRDAILR